MTLCWRVSCAFAGMGAVAAHVMTLQSSDYLSPLARSTPPLLRAIRQCRLPWSVRGRRREDDDFPIGANLRTTRLDPAALKMTIRCGRAGTSMPSFDEGAYTTRECYGRSSMLAVIKCRTRGDNDDVLCSGALNSP
jgi:hypothetical protein